MSREKAIPSLVALSRGEFAAEKEVAGWSRKLDLLAAALCFSSAFALSNPAIVAVTLGAAAATSGGRVLAYLAANRHRAAERMRRALALWEGLGQAPTPQDESEMRASSSERARQLAGTFDEATYYRLDGTKGPSRLRRLLQESAFWTGHLCRAAGIRRIWPTTLVGILLLGLIVSVASSGSATLTVLSARAVAIALCSIVALETMTEGLTFLNVAESAKDLDRRLETLGDNPSIERLLPHLSSYDVLVATIPAIPEGLYERERDRLAAVWEKRLTGYVTPVG